MLLRRRAWGETGRCPGLRGDGVDRLGRVSGTLLSSFANRYQRVGVRDGVEAAMVNAQRGFDKRWCYRGKGSGGVARLRASQPVTFKIPFARRGARLRLRGTCAPLRTDLGLIVTVLIG